jgi:hypothetical protein
MKFGFSPEAAGVATGATGATGAAGATGSVTGAAEAGSGVVVSLRFARQLVQKFAASLFSVLQFGQSILFLSINYFFLCLLYHAFIFAYGII